MTDEENIFEVKQWKGGSAYWEIEQQLDNYLLYGANLNLLLYKGTEIRADSVDVITGLRCPWSTEIGYVWGLGNSEGHIYVSKDEDDRLPDDMTSQADESRTLRDHHEAEPPMIPIPVPVPVPV